MNISVKFHQNAISTFREEDFLKKKLSDGRMDGRTDDGQQAMT